MTFAPDAPAVRQTAPAVLISTLCSVTFLVSSTGTAIAPFLLEMARDLRTELAAVGNLVSVLSVAWGAMSLAAGAASDRLGRRPILVLGVLTLGAARLGLARAEPYARAAAWRLAPGVGRGAYLGTELAAVSDHVAPAQRGRALGWVITGQSLSLVFGVPLLTFIGSFGGWRGAIAAQAAATLAAALVIRLVVPRASGRRSAEHMSAGSVAKLFNARVLALLGASAMERACFAAMTVYLATFLLTSYGVSLAELAGGLVLVALGNLAGNLLGGQLADRLPSRPLTFAVSSVATAILAFPLMLWLPGFLPSIGPGVCLLAGQRARPASADGRAQRGLQRSARRGPGPQHHRREPRLDRRHGGGRLAHHALRLREPQRLQRGDGAPGCRAGGGELVGGAAGAPPLNPAARRVPGRRFRGRRHAPARAGTIRPIWPRW